MSLFFNPDRHPIIMLLREASTSQSAMLMYYVYMASFTLSRYLTPVVPKVGGTAPLGAVRNSRGALKQK